MRSSGTRNHEKSATRAPQKTLKKKTTKSWTRPPFWGEKRSSISRLFGALFEPWAALGPNWSPSLPRDPPGWSQTLDLMIFHGFWMDFWLLFAFAHLSAITFLQLFWDFCCSFFEFPNLSATTKMKSTVAGSARNALRYTRKVWNDPWKYYFSYLRI